MITNDYDELEPDLLYSANLSNFVELAVALKSSHLRAQSVSKIETSLQTTVTDAAAAQVKSRTSTTI